MQIEKRRISNDDAPVLIVQVDPSEHVWPLIVVLAL